MKEVTEKRAKQKTNITKCMAEVLKKENTILEQAKLSNSKAQRDVRTQRVQRQSSGGESFIKLQTM